jgi:hypothetical protein
LGGSEILFIFLMRSENGAKISLERELLAQNIRLFSMLTSECTIANELCSQSAIVIGAALRGLEGLTPLKRKCRRHYGVGVGAPFRLGKDPEQFRYQDAATKTDFCSGRAKWLLVKVKSA